jgi:hypothetical protein
MTQKELLEKAIALGLEAEESESPQSLQAKIKAATGEDTPKGSSLKPKKGFKRIIIHEQKDDQRPVPVAVNGKAWLIKRGEMVEVPDYIVHVLENTIGDSVHMVNNEVIHRKYQRYPFQYA